MPNEAHVKSLLKGLAHDLRGSFGASAKLAAMLKDSYADKLDGPALTWLEMIATEYATSKRKLLGISSLAHLYDYHVQIAECSLSEIAIQALQKSEEALTQIQPGNIQLVSDLQSDTQNLPIILTSCELITQYINELFLNTAAHAVPIKSTLINTDSKPLVIKSEFRYVDTNNSHLLLYADNGHLLKPKDLEYIKAPFNTLKSSRSVTPSAGLGLSKLARIAELLDATLIFSIGTNEYTGLQLSLEIPKV